MLPPAFSALRAARSSAIRGVRSYASAPQKSGGSNVGIFLGAAGAAGLGYWAYLQRSDAGAAKKTNLADQPNPYLNDKEWLPVKLSKVKKYNDNTNVYEFDFLGEDAANKTSGLTVASCIMVRSPTGENALKDDKGKPVIRPYTPVTHPLQKGSLDLIIKEYPTGAMGPYIASLKPGDEVLFKGPFLKLEYKPNVWDKALFVAGGSGVTPAYQLISHALEQPNDKTKFTFLFANVSEKDVLLRKEWDALQAAHPDRLKVVYFLDNPTDGWKGETGYVTADKIKEHFPRADGESVKAFVCGPPAQYAAVSGEKKGREQGPLGGALKELGYTEEEVFKF